MNSAMSDSFEARKNTKAFSYTAIICGLIVIIAILYTWPLQVPLVPTAQDLIEINLGNEKEGMGDVQPLVKGDPAPEERNIPEPAKSSAVKYLNRFWAEVVMADSARNKHIGRLLMCVAFWRNLNMINIRYSGYPFYRILAGKLTIKHSELQISGGPCS